MVRRIAIIQGHPDCEAAHLCHALAEAYAEGARGAGHPVQLIDTGAIDLPYVRNQTEWAKPSPLESVRSAQHAIEWAEHLVIFYPLWLGDVPAKLKSFFEHVSSGGFAIEIDAAGHWTKKLTGRSARIVVTMGMPALAYRFWYFSHSLKSLERNFLKFAGVAPVRSTLLGMVEGEARAPARAAWLEEIKTLGGQGA